MIKLLNIVLLLNFVVAVSLAAPAANTKQDNLKAFHTKFCDIAKLAKDPQKACRVLTMLHKSDYTEDEIDDGVFGDVLEVLKNLGDNHIIISVMTYKELKALQYDTRILAMAPDAPMGPVGSFTVSN